MDSVSTVLIGDHSWIISIISREVIGIGTGSWFVGFVLHDQLRSWICRIISSIIVNSRSSYINGNNNNISNNHDCNDTQ